jgi:hypothetical protein
VKPSSAASKPAIGVLAAVSVTPELTTGRLIALPWNGPALALTSYLVAHKRRWISPAHAALREATHHSVSVEEVGRAEDLVGARTEVRSGGLRTGSA